MQNEYSDGEFTSPLTEPTTIESLRSPIMSEGDLLYTVKFLGDNYDPATDTFDALAEFQATQHIASGKAEKGAHHQIMLVHQRYNTATGHYEAMGDTDIGITEKGRDRALEDLNANALTENLFWRAQEECVEAKLIAFELREELIATGGLKLIVSAEPTAKELPEDLAKAANFDGRTMIRMQSITEDGSTKTMASISLFDAPAEAFAAYYNTQGAEIEPTALAVMQHSNAAPIITGKDTIDVINEVVSGIRSFVDEEQRISLDRQLERFHEDQDVIATRTLQFAAEELDFYKEIARSNDIATDTLCAFADTVYRPDMVIAHEFDKRRLSDGRYTMDDNFAELLIRVKLGIDDTLFGLASGNTRTINEVADQIGHDKTLDIMNAERAITNQEVDAVQAMLSRSESVQTIIDNAVSCSNGGCTVRTDGILDRLSDILGPDGAVNESNKLLNGDTYTTKIKCKACKKHTFAKGDKHGTMVCQSCAAYKHNGTVETNAQKKYEAAVKEMKEAEANKQAARAEAELDQSKEQKAPLNQDLALAA